jgi:carboxymethylenebutenolidase
MGALAVSDGIDDLVSTIGWIKAQRAADAANIGVMGFCMGGSYSTLLPCLSTDIKAAVTFYGEIPSDDQLEHLGCPIFYAYGEKDDWIQRKDVDRLGEALRKFNKPGEVKIYTGCSHGFFNDTRTDLYSTEDAKDAWKRTLTLFAANLRGRRVVSFR